MHRIPAGNLFASASSLGSTCKFLQVGRRRLREERAPALWVDPDDMKVAIEAASFLRSASAALSFVACRAAAEEFGDALGNLLCDGTKCLAFDHDQAFFGIDRTAEVLASSVDCLPELFLSTELSLDWDGSSLGNIRAVASRWSTMHLDFSELDQLTTITTGETLDAIKAFLCARLSNLQTLADAAIDQGG